MDSVGENVGVYSEAKSEYTRQLCQFLVPALLTYFLETVEDVKQKDTDTRKLLWNFQNHLKDVPDWNVDKVKRETDRIQTLVKCDYLEELLTAVFIAHTKVLSAIRLSTKQKKLQISIPKIEHFLHRTVSDCSRLIWSNVYLFSPTGAAVERQKNLNTVEGLLNEGILQSIRTMLPVKSILREYLHDDIEEDEDDAKADDTKPEVVAAEATKSEPVAAEATKPEPVAAEATKPEPVAVTLETTKPEPVAVTERVVVAELPKPVVVAELPKPEPVVITEPPKHEPVVASAATEPEVASAVTEPPKPPAQTIVVDTEPSVRFTNIDTVFNSTGDVEEVSLEEIDDDMLQFVDSTTTGLDGNMDYEEL